MRSMCALAAVLLLGLPSAAEPVTLEADAMAVSGGLTGWSLRYLHQDRSTQAEPWAAGSLSMAGADIMVEEWYQDSGGLPIAVDQYTQIRVAYEGAVDEVQSRAKASHEQFVLAPDDAPVTGVDSFEAWPHAEKSRPFPSYVPATGEEIVTPVDDAVQVSGAGPAIVVHAPATVVLWNWNLTIMGPEGTHETWSGSRPHGAGNDLFALQGYDTQIIVIHIRDGRLGLPLPEEDLVGMFAAQTPFRLVGTLTAFNARIGPGAPTDAVFEGNLSVTADLASESRLRLRLDEQVAPVPGPVPPLPVPTPAPEPTGTVPENPGTGPWWVLIAALVLLLFGRSEVRWRLLVRAYSGRRYGYVQKHAGRFHGRRWRGGRAQVMTVASLINRGHWEFAAEVLPSMDRIDPTSRAALQDLLERQRTGVQGDDAYA